MSNRRKSLQIAESPLSTHIEMPVTERIPADVETPSAFETSHLNLLVTPMELPLPSTAAVKKQINRIVLIWSLGFIALWVITFVAASWNRWFLPAAQPAVNILFSATEAYTHIESLTGIGPRALTQPEKNKQARDYIVQTLNQWITAARASGRIGIDLVVDSSPLNIEALPGQSFEVGDDIVTDDPSGARGLHSKSISFLNNIQLRIAGQSALKGAIPNANSTLNAPAVLLSCHYDTVTVAPGATDDTAAVSILMRIAQQMLSMNVPPEQSVIFLWNNGEETGLLGSQRFVLHPWRQDVRAFMNFGTSFHSVNVIHHLEGAGGGGRAILFRASDFKAVQQYGKYAVNPHANVIGNDVFKLGLLASDTDYSIYSTREKIPGLDIAFYERRGVYHTPKDSVINLPVESVQHMGNIASSVLYGLLQEDLPLRNATMDSPIYYDMFGRGTFVWTREVYLGLSIAAFIVMVVVLVLLRTPFSPWPYFATLWFTFLFTLFLSLALVMMISSVNPAIFYGYPQLLFLFTLLANLLSFSFVSWLQNKVKKLSFSPLSIGSDGAMMEAVGWFWSFWLLICVATAALGIGLFYFVYWFAVMTLVAIIVLRLLQKFHLDTYFYPSSFFVIVSWLWPSAVVLDICLVSTMGLSGSLAEGASPLFLGAAVSLMTALGTVNLSPLFLPHATRRWVVIPLIVSLIISIVVGMTVFPFTSTSPIKTQYSEANQTATFQGPWVKIAMENTLTDVQCSSPISCEFPLPNTPQYNGRMLPFNGNYTLSDNGSVRSIQMQIQLTYTAQCQFQTFGLANATTSLVTVQSSDNRVQWSTDRGDINLMLRMDQKNTVLDWTIQGTVATGYAPFNMSVTCGVSDQISFLDSVVGRFPNWVTVTPRYNDALRKENLLIQFNQTRGDF